MSFLAPLFLLGAAAVAFPIVFHLIRRTAREKLTFSSLMFLKPSLPRVTRRTRLENIWLLLLRCCVLVLLALAFSRPFFKKAGAFPDSKRGPKEVVVLFDTSASMRPDVVWNTARDLASRKIRELKPEDQVAVFSFDRGIHSLMSFEQWKTTPPTERISSALKTVTDLKPGWAGTDLGNALVAASQLFGELESASTERHREIILISDLQEGSRLDALKGFEWPRTIHVTVERAGKEKISNAGVHYLPGSLAAAATNGMREVKLRLSNASNSTRDKYKVQFFHENKAAGVPMEQSAPVGQHRVFSFPIPEQSFGEVRLSGDELDFDNRCFIAGAAKSHAQLLFLGETKEKDPANLLFYLKRAFELDQDRVNIVSATGKDALPSSLDDFSLIIVGDEISTPASQLLFRAVQQGKTLLFVLKEARLARSLGDLLQHPGLNAEEVRPASYSMLGEIDFTHPIFLPFADPRFSDFTKIHFWKHRKLSSDLPQSRVLARFDNQDPALLQIPVGKGTVFILMTGWQPADSQLALSSKFVPLLYSLVEQGGGLGMLPEQFFVGDPIPLAPFQNVRQTKLESTSSQGVMKIRNPAGVEAVLSPETTIFNDTDQPGLYTINPGNHLIAVNVLPEESRTAPLSLQTLEALGVPLKTVDRQGERLALKAARERNAIELEAQQKLWRVLIVAVLMVLMVEIWMAARITNRARIQVES